MTLGGRLECRHTHELLGLETTLVKYVGLPSVWLIQARTQFLSLCCWDAKTPGRGAEGCAPTQLGP